VFTGRRAIQLNVQGTVYDTLNKSIAAVSPRQGGDMSLTFSSPFCIIAVSNLPIVSDPGKVPVSEASIANQQTFGSNPEVKDNTYTNHN
jgi:hypothetical protein